MDTVARRGRKPAGANIDLNCGQQQLWCGKRRVPRVAHLHECILRDAVMDVDILLLLRGDAGLPAVIAAARGLVVVAKKQPRRLRKGQHTAD